MDPFLSSFVVFFGPFWSLTAEKCIVSEQRSEVRLGVSKAIQPLVKVLNTSECSHNPSSNSDLMDNVGQNKTKLFLSPVWLV